MKLGRCPSCHGNINLDALLQSNNAKDLLKVVAKLPSNLASASIAYVALFRPEKSDLNNARATKLLNEVLELTHNQAALVKALEDTVITIQSKRREGTAQPLKNHNYLGKVLDTIIEHHKHPMNIKNKEVTQGAVIKVQGVQETAEENQTKFEEIHNRYKKT